MKFNTVKVWLVENNKSIKAKSDISLITEFGELSIKGFRIVCKAPDILFVAPPQEKYQQNGVNKFKDILWLDRKFQDFLYTEIMKEYRKLAANLRVA